MNHTKPTYEQLENQIADLLRQNEEIRSNSALAGEEKKKRAAELIIANIELALQNKEKSKRAAELIIANIELVYQSEEKEKQTAELIIANLALALQDELIIEKERAEASEKDLKIANEEYLAINEELVQTNDELLIAKDRAEDSEKLKTAFLQNMSHEIRTPMNAIIGFSRMLERPELTSEKRKSFTTIIINSTNQLLSIVTNILTISALETKQERATIEKVSINSIIVDLLAIFKVQAFNHNVSIYAKQHLTDKQSEIYTDATKIIEILTNLITNALKFTHQGNIEFGYNLIENNNDENFLEFYVKDTGIGIDEEMQDKIFERFRQVETSTTKKYSGTGLGLSISKGFVELLGGTIWVKSELNKGTTFYFTIPYQPVHELQKSKGKKNTILVAEDDEYNFLLIEELLNDTNFDIIHAKNGQETVVFCKTNLNIKLILMDIKMPLMDGKTAAKLIKEFRPDLPIIAQTAYALEHEIKQFNGTDFDDYIIKPICEKELKQKLQKFIVNQ